MYLVYDIETVVNSRARHYYDTLKDAGLYTAPSNYKDPEKIAAYIENAIQADMAKGALRWWTGQIIAIGCELVHPKQERKMFISLEDEEKVLRGFFDYIEAISKSYSIEIIGKQNKDFDDPYVRGRAMYHNIGLPPQFRSNRSITDVNEIFGISSSGGQRGKLRDYAYGLGLPTKLADGADVAGMATAKNTDAIAAYCARDVEITAEIVRRYTKQYTSEV